MQKSAEELLKASATSTDESTKVAELRAAIPVTSAGIYLNAGSNGPLPREVEAAMREAVGARPVRCLVDLGAGASRMLEIFAPLAQRAIGVDLSSAMLAVARGRLEETGLPNVQLRQGDMYALPIERNSADLAIMHQVLHYLDDPARAIREAAVEGIPHEIETRKRLCPKYRRQRFYFVPVFHPVTSDDADRLEVDREVRQPAGVGRAKRGPVIGVSYQKIKVVRGHHRLHFLPALYKRVQNILH